MLIFRRYPLWIGLLLLWILLILLGITFGICGLIALFWGVSARISMGKNMVRNGAIKIEENIKSLFELKDWTEGNSFNLVIANSLSTFNGVEGGLWDGEQGFIAYSYPTYEGSLKLDVPSAEKNRIVTLALESLKKKESLLKQFDGKRETILLYVRPLESKKGKTVIWTMTRVPIRLVSDYEKLAVFLSFLLIFSLFLGIFGLRILHAWSKEIARIEQIIATTPPDQIPSLVSTGFDELDKLVATLINAKKNLIAEKNRKEELMHKLIKNERIVALGRMAATLVHELRNPLATIQLEAENALETDGTMNKEGLYRILDQVARMGKLLESIVLLSHAGEIMPQLIDLSDWIQSQIQKYGLLANKCEVELRVVPCEGNWVFDPQSMARAFENLLQNSLEHTPKGGWIEVALERKDNSLCLSVEDSGKGIEEDLLESIFEPFFTKKSSGFGLGLSIVKEIVEAHNGRIEYKKGREGGARFEIYLPSST
ncbi:two-component sensor histidine kinase [Methylacidiphilum sp. Yel]|jgi:signal transduction histidine kinase|uniref:sensor histidine kinase n=1 Tax=Methylacidiphilum sp. Yel TaxID=1847730 RepID=UPI001068DB4F|nr:HAMP domain-containing sensor histidine kinase [Methylacidiphilum sp. Yel]TFE66325.1 two-component sensor histidine kinase [Methylacidiphilum sp. Yel]